MKDPDVEALELPGDAPSSKLARFFEDMNVSSAAVAVDVPSPLVAGSPARALPASTDPSAGSVGRYSFGTVGEAAPASTDPSAGSVGRYSFGTVGEAALFSDSGGRFLGAVAAGNMREGSSSAAGA